MGSVSEFFRIEDVHPLLQGRPLRCVTAQTDRYAVLIRIPSATAEAALAPLRRASAPASTRAVHGEIALSCRCVVPGLRSRPASGDSVAGQVFPDAGMRKDFLLFLCIEKAIQSGLHKVTGKCSDDVAMRRGSKFVRAGQVTVPGTDSRALRN